MENVLQRRSDFRNAERDRDEYSDGGCDHVFVDPATTRVSDLGSATKEYNKLYVEDAALTGILTVTGTTTVSDVVKPSTNQLIDLGGPTNQWRSFYAQDATLSDGLTVDGGSRVDGVYTRSYDVSVAATPLSFSAFCEITESGAYIAHIEVVQTVSGSSTSSSYIVTHAGHATEHLLAYLVQRAYSSSVADGEMSSWDNTALETCRPSI
jgi:hypothetical protein